MSEQQTGRPAGTGPGDPLVVSESDALALLAHLVTSAELCMSEPYDYGIFRLIDAASRLATAMVFHSTGADRDFLEAFLADVNVRKMLPTRDRDRYLAFLRETSRLTAQRLVARAGEPATAGPVSAPRAPRPEVPRNAD